MEQQDYTKDCWNGPCNCPEHQPNYRISVVPTEDTTTDNPSAGVASQLLQYYWDHPKEIDDLLRKTKHEETNEQT